MDGTFYHISEKAVEHVAEQAVLTVPGVLSLDAQLAGLAGRKYPRVNVHLDRASAIAAVEAEIATTYPAPVAAITDAVRATIIAHIRSLCGLDVSRVQVHVANVQTETDGHRVTWDDVASHSASAEPVGIRISPSPVTSPVTKDPIALSPIEVDSQLDELREVTVPAPPEVRTTGFDAPPLQLTDIVVPPPLETFSPETPQPRQLAEVQRFVPQAASVHAPYPRPVKGATVPPRRALKEVYINRSSVVPVSAPAAPHLRPVGVPSPRPVKRPEAPMPQPLKQITIRPVEKYYDRTR